LHEWPGNVRELENLVERLVVLGREAEVSPGDLPATIGGGGPRAISFGSEVVSMREMQRQYAQWAYDQLGGRKRLAAERLDLDLKTLGKWLRAEGAAEEAGTAEARPSEPELQRRQR
jgi:two-component system response regulator HydG